MSVSLVYHPMGACPDYESPFEAALKRVIDGTATLDIACPYISLDILREVTGMVSAWRLVTDIEALMKAEPSEAQAIASYIGDHKDAIRDYRMLHAKVFLGTAKALVGSANMTHAGFEQRTEMSVLLEDPQQMNELRQWYVELWAAAGIPATAEVAEYASQKASERESEEARREPSLGMAGKQVRARRAFSLSPLQRVEMRQPEAGGGIHAATDHPGASATPDDKLNLYQLHCRYAIRARVGVDMSAAARLWEEMKGEYPDRKSHMAALGARLGSLTLIRR
ncbi:MAG: phospholipase D-like domain-containing protein [Pseudomonadota bacterium]